MRFFVEGLIVTGALIGCVLAGLMLATVFAGGCWL